MSKENLFSEAKVNITNQDKIVLEQGLQKIYNYLEEKYKENSKKLPKVLIFPDTAARLLVYVVKPLFDYFYKQHHLSPPALIFIRTPQQGAEPTPKELDLLDQRAEEIKNKLHLREGDKVLVIDDVCYQGETFRLISGSLNKTKPNLEIEGFFFVKYLDLPKNCYYGVEEFGFNFDFYLYGEDHTGVSKDSPKNMLKKISDFQPQYVASLRKALATVGQEFVSSLESKNSA